MFAQEVRREEIIHYV